MTNGTVSLENGASSSQPITWPEDPERFRIEARNLRIKRGIEPDAFARKVAQTIPRFTVEKLRRIEQGVVEPLGSVRNAIMKAFEAV